MRVSLEPVGEHSLPSISAENGKAWFLRETPGAQSLTHLSQLCFAAQQTAPKITDIKQQPVYYVH